MTVPTAETAADTGSALPDGIAQDDLRLPDELRASLSPGLAAGLLPRESAAPPEDDADADVSDASDDVSDGEPEGDTEETSTGDEDPDAGQVDGFVQSLIDNPAAITRVPRAMQARVMEAFVTNVASAVGDLVKQQQGQAQGEYQRGYKAAKAEYAVATADQLFEEGDLDAFKAFVTKELGSVENYHRLKAGEPLKPTGEQADLQSEALTLYREFVQDFPAAEEQLRQMWAKGYPQSREGIRKLTRDIERLRVRMEVGAAGNDPASQELSRRKAAADHRAQVPRPPVSSSGARSAPAITKEWIAAQDPTKLAKQMEDPAFEAKVNEAVARG